MTSPRPTVTIRPANVDDATQLHDAILAIAEHVGELEHVASTAEDLRRFGFGEIRPSRR